MERHNKSAQSLTTRKRVAQKPSLAEEAWGSIYQTAEFLHRHSAPIFAEGDITSQQYNVLRILRGAGQDGLATLEVGSRMVESAPGITRLLDRLELKKLVTRKRSSKDRRLQMCSLSASGYELLARLDPVATKRSEAAMAPLSSAEMKMLIELLNRIRTL